MCDVSVSEREQEFAVNEIDMDRRCVSFSINMAQINQWFLSFGQHNKSMNHIFLYSICSNCKPYTLAVPSLNVINKLYFLSAKWNERCRKKKHRKKTKHWTKRKTTTTTNEARASIRRENKNHTHNISKWNESTAECNDCWSP